MEETIQFTKEHVMAYLDKCILYWRNEKYKHAGMDAPEKLEIFHMARCYLDAYQSVRESLFGEVLK